MDICFISFSNIIDDVRIAKEVKELIRAGYKVGGLGVDVNHNKVNAFNITKLNLYLSSIKYSSNNVESSWSKISKNFIKVLHCCFTIKMLIKLRPKTVHVCNLELLIAVFLVCKIFRIKIVYDSFEIWADMGRTLFRNTYLNKIISFVSKMVFMFLEKHIVRRIDGFICVSHSMAEYFALVYNVKPPIVLTNCPYSIDAVLPKYNENIEVLYHGIYSPGRGIEELIMSATGLNDRIKIVLRLSYVANMQYLNDLIDNFNVGRNVVFSDPVPMSAVVAAASRSHIGVVFTLPTNTNHIHTVSNKIFDYINAGIPVIMTNVKEHIYLNNIYNFGIILDNFSEKNIAKAINILVDDTVLYKSLSSNCLTAAKVLNWKVESKKLVNLYKQLLI